jgi:hypothetical protein
MQANWTVDQEPLPNWLEELEPQASDIRRDLEQEQTRARLQELEALLDELPAIFERKFEQRLQPVLDQQQLLMAENKRLQAQVERLMPQPGEVRLRFPERRPPMPQRALPMPPLLRVIRGGRSDVGLLPKAEWEDPTHK